MTDSALLEDPLRLAAYVDSAIGFEMLPVAEDWRPAVITHFTAIAAAARIVMSPPLDDLVEVAPIFQA